MISLRNNEISLIVNPLRGGGILKFDWRGEAIFWPAQHDDCDPLGLANFVLVPFSNRIANGQFSFDSTSVNMPPNHPPASSIHAIHGHGWTEAWEVISQSNDMLCLRYQHIADSWPWDYVAEQQIALTADGYIHGVSITNSSRRDMPAGLGLHPYFPRDGAKLHTVFSGFWDTADDGLPTDWIDRADIYDLSGNDPVDTVFTGRKNALEFEWPNHRLTMTPNADLSETHIYAPKGEDYFCVEPVSHMTDAINRDGLKILAPGERWSTQVAFSVTSKVSVPK